ncbi:MAG: hypothetical protein ACKOBV_04665 [Candidatus Kapaibacterium sp.]
MKKFIALFAVVTLFAAYCAPVSACDADGKCKGKASGACCMSKASAKKSCCSMKGSSAKAEVKDEGSTATTAVDASSKATAVKPASAPKVNPNK